MNKTVTAHQFSQQGPTTSRWTATIALLALSATLSACRKSASAHDASGVFEARETIIAAEVAGRILQFPIEEGQTLPRDTPAVELDCNGLQLQKVQLQASEHAITQKNTEAKPQLEILREQQKAAEAQLAVQREQLAVLSREQARFAELVKAQAVPAKQLADIEGQISILRKQMGSTEGQIGVIKAQRSSASEQVSLQNRAVNSEREPMQARISIIDEQIAKCKISNPISGTVIGKYAEQYEFATPGKPLYKIADLSTMTLRVYVTGAQLAQVKLGAATKVFVDAGSGFREHKGTITWVSDKAEFTPKTIQTKDERANLVYATKIKVPNDGSLKIGMYGEVTF